MAVNFDVNDEDEILAMEWVSAAIATWGLGESRQTHARNQGQARQVQAHTLKGGAIQAQLDRSLVTFTCAPQENMGTTEYLQRQGDRGRWNSAFAGRGTRRKGWARKWPGANGQVQMTT